jgi:hypothetical protein
MSGQRFPYGYIGALVGVWLLAGCQPGAGDASKTGATDSVASDTLRTTVSTQAVASFNQKVNDPLNPQWYFSVQLYETRKPRDYAVRMDFEEMQEMDTVHFPDLGYPIKPAVKRGPDSLTCFIGFLDPKGQFNYYKSVYVEGRSLHLVTVRTYKLVDK